MYSRTNFAMYPILARPMPGAASSGTVVYCREVFAVYPILARPHARGNLRLHSNNPKAL